jgi:hypothetical protein
MAIPLRPGSLRAVGEVERPHHLAALPPTVSGLVAPMKWVAAGMVDAPPLAADGCGCELGRAAAAGRAQEKESFSSSDTSLETDRYRPSPSASSGVSSFNAGSGFWSQIAT